MPSYIPISIKRSKPYLLELQWDTQENTPTTFLLSDLREECPCAYCKGETIMGKTYTFGIKQFTPGMNELVSLVPVGNYGVQATWKDGHDSGIYTWEMLYTIAQKHALSAEKIHTLDQEYLSE